MVCSVGDVESGWAVAWLVARGHSSRRKEMRPSGPATLGLAASVCASEPSISRPAIINGDSAPHSAPLGTAHFVSFTLSVASQVVGCHFKGIIGPAR